MSCNQTRYPFMGSGPCLKTFAESLLCLCPNHFSALSKAVDLRCIDTYYMIRHLNNEKEVKGFLRTDHSTLEIFNTICILCYYNVALCRGHHSNRNIPTKIISVKLTVQKNNFNLLANS